MFSFPPSFLFSPEKDSPSSEFPGTKAQTNNQTSFRLERAANPSVTFCRNWQSHFCTARFPPALPLLLLQLRIWCIKIKKSAAELKLLFAVGLAKKLDCCPPGQNAVKSDGFSPTSPLWSKPATAPCFSSLRL